MTKAIYTVQQMCVLYVSFNLSYMLFINCLYYSLPWSLSAMLNDTAIILLSLLSLKPAVTDLNEFCLDAFHEDLVSNFSVLLLQDLNP